MAMDQAMDYIDRLQAENIRLRDELAALKDERLAGLRTELNRLQRIKKE
jgi:hypothetical protein